MPARIGAKLRRDHIYRVGRDDRVSAEQGAVFRTGLRHEHTVEGVAMYLGRLSDSGRVCERNWKHLKTLLTDNHFEITIKHELAERLFYRKFPCRCRTYRNRVGWVRNQPACLAREARIVGQPPEQHVCVDEDIHQSARSACAVKQIGNHRIGGIEVVRDQNLALHASRFAR